MKSLWGYNIQKPTIQSQIYINKLESEGRISLAYHQYLMKEIMSFYYKLKRLRHETY